MVERIAWGLVVFCTLFSSVHISAASLNDIEHIIVLILENWSFDGLMGDVPGVNGRANATQDNRVQLDRDLKAYTTLPQHGQLSNAALPNGPFDLTPYIAPTEVTFDIRHTFYNNRRQMNLTADGVCHNNMFVAFSDGVGEPDALCMSYYPSTSLSFVQLARQYTIADNFFMGVYGGSYANHMYLATGSVLTWPGSAPPPAGLNTTLGPDGWPVNNVESSLTPAGRVVNTVFSQQLHSAAANTATLMPPVTGVTTLGDMLTDAGVEWKWYAQQWDAYLSGTEESTFRYHHHPFAYHDRFEPRSTLGRARQRDWTELVTALQTGNGLPRVAFAKPDAAHNGHPGDSSVLQMDAAIRELMNTFIASSYYNSSALLVIWDENGGRWDHACPPAAATDEWGPGSRIPAVIVSPWARRNFVDSTYYDTGSIHKLLAKRWSLPGTLPGIRSAAGDLTAAFDFSTAPPPTPVEPYVDSTSFDTGTFVIAFTVPIILLMLVLLVCFKNKRKRRNANGEGGPAGGADDDGDEESTVSQAQPTPRAHPGGGRIDPFSGSGHGHAAGSEQTELSTSRQGGLTSSDNPEADLDPDEDDEGPFTLSQRASDEVEDSDGLR